MGMTPAAFAAILIFSGPQRSAPRSGGPPTARGHRGV